MIASISGPGHAALPAQIQQNPESLQPTTTHRSSCIGVERSPGRGGESVSAQRNSNHDAGTIVTDAQSLGREQSELVIRDCGERFRDPDER